MQSRRKFLGYVGMAALAPSIPAWADDPYPSRPVKMIVPVAAGGGTDFTARTLAEMQVLARRHPGASW